MARPKNLKESIQRLRKEGHTYKQISEILNCNRGTVSYHCNPNTRAKTIAQSYKSMENRHPYYLKLMKYVSKKVPNNRIKTRNPTVYSLIQGKLVDFSRPVRKKEKIVSRSKKLTFNQVIEKFGETPTCYLTGDILDINRPDTYQFDHKIPRSRGGLNTLDNLGITSSNANRSKLDMLPDEFLELCKKVVKHAGFDITPTHQVSFPKASEQVSDPQ